MIRGPRRHGLAITAACLALATTAPTLAHPLATTTVSIAVDHGPGLDVAIAADVDPLIAKLEALAGLPASSPRTREDRAERLRALMATLFTHIDLRVDDARTMPVLRQITIDETAQAEIRLTAAMAPGAREVTWRSTFIFGSYPVAVRGSDGREAIEWLQGPQPSAPIALAAAATPVGFIRGLAMGFTHIVPAGVDHILFVVGLFLMSRRTREVLLQVTAFTLAHSVTLGLSLYGLVSAPASIVEPMIALSVAYVGVENLMTSRLHPWRVAVVFAFGLLHGMGFAEALAGLRLSASSLATTLISFNLGVELGQLSVIATAAAMLALLTRVREAAGQPAARLASAAIGVAGVVWTIERLI
jgi:hydrogenase/urease accessory protein HupE